MNQYPYERTIVNQIFSGFSREKRLLHIITGPRQVGKTVASLQIAAKWQGETVMASADLPIPPGPEWIHAQWEMARRKARRNRSAPVLLVLDEVQKVAGWSEAVKALWDEDLVKEKSIEVLLLGSSALLLQKGVTESLAGRFYIYRCGHWSYAEMKKAFGWDLETYLFYGGYPGAALLINDSETWFNYVRDALIETVLSRDVLQLHTITKPALLRSLFFLACIHPAQILSYNKMLGQLQDAGNTTTLAHYLKLLESAYLLSGLEAFRWGRKTRRGSSPKLILWNNALVNAVVGQTFDKARDDPAWWGRIVENAVGAHILNGLSDISWQVFYWRYKGREVDFVVKTPRDTWAIEVKSGASAFSDTTGLDAFKRNYPEARPFIVGQAGMGLEDFFSTEPSDLFV